MHRRRWPTVSVSLLLILTMVTVDLAQTLAPPPAHAQPAAEGPAARPDAPAADLNLAPGATCSDSALQVGATPLPPRSRLAGELLAVGPELSVNTGSGALVYQGAQLAIPSRGPEFQASLDYHSLYRETDDGWGYGWGFDRDWRYQVEGNGDVTVLLDRGGYAFVSDGQGGFISPVEGITLTQGADTYVLALSDGEELYFESPVHQRITRWEDAEGRALTFAYDLAGQLETITGDQGRQMTFTWSSDRLQTIADLGSTPARWLGLNYSPAGDLITVTDALSNTTALSYDAEHRLTGLTDPRGVETVITYTGDYVAQIQRGGIITAVDVDETTNTITLREMDAQGGLREQVYLYNYAGVLQSVTYPDGATTSQNWDGVQHQYSTTDENGHTAALVLDEENRRLTASRDPLGQTTTYTYHPPLDALAAVTDPNGRATAFEYDTGGRMCAMVDPLGNRLSYGRDGFGDVITITDPLSRTSTLNYDENGALTTVTNALGVSIGLAYDPAGNLISTTDGNGHTLGYAYDPLGRPVVITDALGYTLTMAYDGAGNLVRQTDRNGNAVSIAYDDLDRPVVITDALGGELQLAYDAWGNPASLTDARGYTTSYTFDERDRMTAQIDPLGQSITYGYDAAGNLTELTNARGQVVTTTYDAADRPIRLDYPGEDDVYTFYDPAGQVTGKGDADLDVGYSYDAAGRITQVTYGYDGVAFTPLELTHSYDAAGQLISTTLPGGEVLNFEHDLAGRLIALTGGGGRQELVYDDGDRLIQVAPALGQPGAQVGLGYDAADRLITMTHASADGGVTFHTLSTAYDPSGNVLTATRNGGSTSYSYDPLGRLTDVTYTDGSWEGYTYDAVGNRLGLESATGGVSYLYDAADQLVVMTDTRAGPPAVTSFIYDQDGNLISRVDPDGTIAYTWDAAGRLTRIDFPGGGHIAYTYGPDGQRLSRRGRDGQTVFFVYDGQNLVEEWSAAGELLATYVHGEELDRPFSMSRGGGTYFYLYDQLGSVIGLTDGAGTLVERYQYDAWGVPVGGSGGVENPFRFAGREWDPEAELYYNRARYYDPSLGRFLSRDPLGPLDGTNRYVYVGNNPASYGDPMGTSRTADQACEGRCKCFNSCFKKFMNSDLVTYVNLVSTLISGSELAKDLLQKGFEWSVKKVLSVIHFKVGALNGILGKLNLLPDGSGMECFDMALSLVTEAVGAIISIASAIGGITAGCASVVTGIGAALCAAAVAVAAITSVQTGMLIGATTGCWENAQKCLDKEDPTVLLWEDGNTCDLFYVTADDNCQLVTDPSGTYPAQGAQQDLTAVDKEGNDKTVTVPACRSDCEQYEKPTCTEKCTELKWVQNVCEWQCVLKADNPPDCPFCQEPAWDSDNCVWECVDPPVPPPPDCDPNKCGKRYAPVWDLENCGWKCEGDESNNPCNPDDNRSPAGLQLPSDMTFTQGPATCAAPTATTALDLGLERRIAVLDNGFSISLQNFLAGQGVEADRVRPDFSPEMVGSYPVLMIPSGGLSGYGDSEIMRQRLKQYTENGGVLVVFAQEYGDEFGILPGDLGGYGYDEDLNCHTASAAIASFEPMLMGQSAEVLSLNIDGFFTHWPADTTVLLSRIVNGMPAMLLYPAGDGWVLATTAYADMAFFQGQGTQEEAVLVRDLARWSMAPDLSVDQFGPQDTVTATLTITNESQSPAHQWRYDLYDPWNRLTISDTIALGPPIDPGNSTVVTVTVDLDELAPPEADRYGLWSIDLSLEDDTGRSLQEMTDAYRFGVAHFTAGEDGHGYQGVPYALTVTSETEAYVHGSQATFTYNVFNHSDQEETFKVTWGMPHHSWRRVPGYKGSETITVTAHGMASTSSLLERVVDLDRLRARLWLNGRVVAYATRGFWSTPAVLSQSLVSDKIEYNWGETPVVTVTTTNLSDAPFQVTADLEALAPDGQTFLTDQRTFTATVGVPHVYTLTLPPLEQAGYHPIKVWNAVNDRRTSYLTNLALYLAPWQVEVAVGLDETITAGMPVTQTVRNWGSGALPATTLYLTFTNPAGGTLWAAEEVLPPLAPGQATSVTHPLGDPGPITWGAYGLAYPLMLQGEGIAGTQLALPAQVVPDGAFDQGSYRVGDTVGFTLTLSNTGRFELTPVVTLTVPDLGLTETQPVHLPVGGGAQVPLTTLLPAGYTAGSHPVHVLIKQGESITRTYPFVLPPSKLLLRQEPLSGHAGEIMTLTLENQGGADTLAAYQAVLQDVNGISVLAVAGTVPTITAGTTEPITLTVPLAAASGSYRVRGVLTDTETGQVQSFRLHALVDGATVAVGATTDQLIYLPGDPITATATVSNTGPIPLDDSLLRLRVDAPPEWGWFTHRAGHHGPSGQVSAIVSDTNGLKWMTAGSAVNAFDDGGTPFDQSDDRWQVFDAQNGFPTTAAYDLFIDSTGTKWISSYVSEITLSVLDDNGTPFDVADDSWLHYTSADGLPQTVLSIAEDSAGNIWLGTSYGGVAVFNPGGDPMDMGDDSAWAYFTADDGLAHSRVSIVTVDPDGYKWFVTDNGVSVLDDGGDPHDDSGHSWLTFYEGTGLPDNQVDGMGIDSHGYKWFAGGGAYNQSCGISVLDTGLDPFDGGDNRWVDFTPPYSLRGVVYSLAVDGQDRVLFGVQNNTLGLFYPGDDPFSGTDETWTAFTDDSLATYPRVIHPGAGNQVWSGVSGGLTLLDHGGPTWQAFAADAGIGTQEIALIAAGEAEATWFGGDGIRVLDPGDTPADLHDDQWMRYYESDGLPAGYIPSMVVDGAGYIWLGGPEITVLDHQGTPFDKSGDVWATYDEAHTGCDYAYEIVVDEANRKWLGGFGTASNVPVTVLDDLGTPLDGSDDLTMTYTYTGTLYGITVEDMAIDSAGVKWMTNNCEVFALDDRESPFDTSDDQWATLFTCSYYVVRDIVADQESNIWFAFGSSTGGEVAVLDYNGTLTDPSDDSWHWFNAAGHLAGKWPEAAAVDDQGIKWFATEAGLTRLDDGGDPFDGLGDTWESFTTELGDPSPDVASVAVGGDGNIWAGFFTGGAAVGAWQGGSVWSTEIEFASLPAMQLTQTLTAISDLNEVGRYVLSAAFDNSLGQTLAADRSAFYITDDDVALLLDAAPDPVSSGAVITVNVTLVNTSAFPLSGRTVQVSQDGTTVHTEGPFDVPAYGSYPFTLTTAAPGVGDSTSLLASAGSVSVEQVVVVGRLIISADASAPAMVGSDPFSVTVALTNTGVMTGGVVISDGWSSPTVAVVPAGQTVYVERQAQVCASTTLALELTGDLTATLSVPVSFEQALAAAFSPQSIYAPGLVEIPYLMSSTGQLDTAFTAVITLTDGQHTQFDAHLLAGEALEGALLFDLPAGDYGLGYELYAGACLVASGEQAFSVAPDRALAVRAETATTWPQVLVTATLTNTGSSAVEGSCHIETSFDLVEVPYSLALNESGELTATLDSSSAPADGSYTLTVSAWSNGVLLDQVTSTLLVHQPDWDVDLSVITLVPGVTTTVPVTVHNVGGAGGPYALTLDLHGLYAAQEQGWVGPGDAVTVTYAISVPLDVEARTDIGHTQINGARIPFTYTIAGYQLDMSGALSPRAAGAGQAVTATVRLTDTSGLGAPTPLKVQLAGIGDPQTRTITMTHSAVVTFPLTAPAEGSALLSYGIYHPDGRSLLLDTLRLYVLDEPAGLYPDRTRYQPGETVEMTAQATVTGTLTWQGPPDGSGAMVTGTLALTPGAPTPFLVPLAADLTAGTYRLWYLFEWSGREWVQGTIPFDLDGDRVEVRHVALDHGEAGGLDVVSGTLRLDSLTALSGVDITGRVYAPDGVELVSGTLTIDLPAGDSWVSLPPLVLGSSQAGTYRLRYQLAQGDRELANGWQQFDVAGPVVLGVEVPKAYYLPTWPVTASVAILNGGTPPVTLTVMLDDLQVEQQVISDTGYLVEPLDLGLLGTGVYTLGAQLTDSTGRTGWGSRQVQVVQLAVRVDVPTPDGLEGWHVVTPTIWLWPEIPESTVTYQWDGGPVLQTVENRVEAPADGQHQLTAWAELPQGDVGPLVTATVKLDRVPPELEASVETGTPVTLTLTAPDSTSGPGWIGTWSDGVWSTYTPPLTFASLHTTTVLCQAQDVAGNSGPGVSVEVPPVDQPYGLALGADVIGKEGPPGGLVAYTLRVTNTGVVADAFTVTLASGAWPAQGPESVGPVGAGQGADLVVLVTIPPGATAGEQELAAVTVTSAGDPARSAESLLTTTANVTFGVELQAGRTTRSGAPGGQASYLLRVTNLGNVPDAFDVLVDGNAWPITASGTVGPITVGAYGDFGVTVNIPADAEPGESDLFTLTVRSQRDPTQSDDVELMTEVKLMTLEPENIYLPLILRG